MAEVALNQFASRLSFDRDSNVIKLKRRDRNFYRDFPTQAFYFL